MIKTPSLSRGFTIVELLIVIVIIGILAAITIVAYNGIQARARDSKRLGDANEIMKALEAYKVLNGAYPASANGGAYEVSTASPTTFMSALRTAGPLTSATPIDPINDATASYSYFLYPAGFYGCDAARGKYYVFFIKKLDSQPGTGHGPGFACGTQDFVSFGAYVMGSYTN